MLILHHMPEGESLWTALSVLIDGNPADVPLCRVSAVPYNTPWPGFQRPLDQTEEAGFLSFEADGPVTLTVTYGQPFGEILVRPLSKHVSVQTDGRTATFTLPSPGAYTLEADGFHGALHIFFDPVRDFEAQAASSARTIIRYPAGVHRVGRVELDSDTTVLLDAGAVVYGSFLAACAENVSILGYGIVDGSEEERTSDSLLLPRDYEKPLPHDKAGILAWLAAEQTLDGCIRFYRCRNVRVEGVIMRDAATFALIPAACSNCVFDDVKTIGMWRYNSDGIDLFNCANVVIRNCFLRDFDDCIVIKGICGWDTPEANAESGGCNENILVERCVVWCDWGRNLELGAETNAPEYRNIIFRDCDCIHGTTIYLDIQHHNRADIHDVTFDDIRVEYTKYQLTETLQTDMNAPYPQDQPVRHPYLTVLPIYRMGLFSRDGLNGRTHDVTYRNIAVLTDDPSLPMPESVFMGLDADHTVEHVRISGVTFNGRPVTTREEMRLQYNEFCSDVRVD